MLRQQKRVYQKRQQYWQQQSGKKSKETANMPYPKVQQFKNQIRRRHKQSLISQLRSKLHYLQPDPYNIIPIQQLKHCWQQYLENPTLLVPAEIIKYFAAIQISENRMKVQKIINEVLDVKDVVNTYFVCLCLEVYQIGNDGYFQGVVKNIGGEREIRGREKQKSGEKEEEEKKEEEIVREYDAWGFGYPQQVYLDYFVKYVSKLNQTESQMIERIKIFSQYFQQYWNKHVDQHKINHKLCAQVSQRLLHFQIVIPQTRPLLKTVASTLIQHETPHRQIYYFLKLYLSHSIPLHPSLLLSPYFNQFILHGLKSQPCIKPVLLILQIVFEQPTFFDLIQKQIFLIEILNLMVRMYLGTANKKIKTDLMYAVYNVIFMEVESVGRWVLGVDFGELVGKSQGVVMDVIDVALASLFNYPTLQMCQKLIYSPNFKILQQTNNHLLQKMCPKTWQFILQLIQTFQQLIPMLTSSPSSSPQPQLLHHIEQQLRTTSQKLQTAEWRQNVSQKQQLIERILQIIKICKQTINK